MKKIIFKLLCITLCVALVMSLTGCFEGLFENKEFIFSNQTDKPFENENNSGTQQDIIKTVYGLYGISPTLTKDRVFLYSNNISLSTLIDYSDYVKSHGFVENKDLQEQNKSYFQYVSVLERSSSNDFVSITYENGTATVSYGIECVYDNTYGSASVTYPDNNFSYPGNYQSNKIVCPICNGTKVVVCPSCHGSGKLYTTNNAPNYGFGGSNSYEVGRSCYACGGDGKYMCTHCSGTGYVN